MPKISAVMALYNTPYSFLQVTVESILNQTFSDFELIVVDDDSSIEYRSFFERFKDKRINYIKLEKNIGPGGARNVGIRAAKGDYVAICDSDDVYMPERFEVQADFLDKNPEISLIGGAFKQSNNGKTPLVIEDNEDIKAFMLFNSPFANPLVMFRKDFFIKNNLLYPENVNFGEDYQLWINAMFAGIKMANLKQVLMTYTRRKGQLSKTKAEEQATILKEIYKNIFSNLKIGISQAELDLHFKLNEQDFSGITIDEISNWFDKIIEYNKNSMIFDEQKIIDKKLGIIEQAKKNNNRLFKVKVGNSNLCLSKNLQIYLEKRD